MDFQNICAVSLAWYVYVHNLRIVIIDRRLFKLIKFMNKSIDTKFKCNITKKKTN